MPLQLTPPTNVVWKPIPGTSQELAISSPANVTLYCGTRGPGKTDTQLFSFRQHVGVGYGSFWRGVIFDRQYKNLDDLVSKSKRWFRQFEDGAEFKEAKSDYKWVWPTGEELLFRAAEDKNDYWNYHGQEFPFIGFNELTAYVTLELFDMMMSCNRSSYKPHINGFIHPSNKVIFDQLGNKIAPVNPRTGRLPPPIPLKVFATTNPFGNGHAVVKRRFIDPAKYGEIVRNKSIVFDPDKKEDVEVTRTQVAIFGSWRENPYLDVLYIASILGDSDANRRKAWATGDWNIASGGPFDDVWNDKIHVIDPIIVPETWYVDRAFDWGSTHPGCYQLWAESNGEDCMTVGGNVVNYPAGTLICVGELYSGDLGTNVGYRWGATKWAEQILAFEAGMIESGRIRGRIADGPADNQIRNVNEQNTETIEKKFNDAGVFWEKSDKSPGSRKNGLELARQRMLNAVKGEGAGIYICRDCPATFTTVPTLPRDEKIVDDVATKDVEDHPWDAMRYRVLKGNNRAATDIDSAWGT